MNLTWDYSFGAFLRKEGRAVWPCVWGTLINAVIADTPVRSGLMLSEQRHAQSSAAALLAWQHEQFSGQSLS